MSLNKSPNNSFPFINNNSNNKNSNRPERNPKTVNLPCETCRKTNHFTEKWYYGANAANRPTPRNRRPERQNQVQQRNNQNNSNENSHGAAQSLN